MAPLIFGGWQPEMQMSGNILDSWHHKDLFHPPKAKSEKQVRFRTAPMFASIARKQCEGTLPFCPKRLYVKENMTLYYLPETPGPHYKRGQLILLRNLRS